MSLDERSFLVDQAGSIYGTTGYLTVGELAYGVISGSGGLYGDHDYYSFVTQPGVTYTIIASPATWPTLTPIANANPYFFLRTASGAYIDDSLFTQGNEVYTFTANSYATYYVDVQGYFPVNTGGYAVGLWTNVYDDFDDTTTQTIGLGYQRNGTLEQVGDTDRFAISTQAGNSYFFQVSSSSITDLFVDIKNAYGAVLAYDVVYTGVSGSFTATSTGTAYLGVSSDSFLQTGTYSIFYQERFDNSKILSVGYTGGDSIKFNDFASREVWGWDGNDVISLGGGSDFIAGGGGNDTLTGGGAGDIFYFEPSGNGIDRITDFSFGDVIAIGGVSVSGSVSSGSGSSVGLGGVQISTGSSTTTLYVGTNGVMGSDLQIVLDGIYATSQFDLSGGFIRYKAYTPPPTKFGTAGNDTMFGGAGNDTLNGLGGYDTVQYGGPLADYTINKSINGYTVQSLSDGTDLLTNIEQVRFADMSVNLVVQGKAAATPHADVDRLIELYVAFFNRVPDADGLSYWIDQKNAGQTINQIAESFYNAGVQYSSLTGFSPSMTNADFVNVVYRNVLGRQEGADAGGLAYWTGELASGSASRGSLVSTILDSAHTFKGDPTWGWVANLLDNKIAVARTFAVDWGLNYNTPEDSISHGMAIAAAITPTGIDGAIALIGISDADINLG